MNIKQLFIENSKELAVLCRETFIDTYAAYNTAEDMLQYIESHFTNEAIEQELQLAGVLFYGIYDADDLVAYTKINTNSFCKTAPQLLLAEVARLYVKPSFQHKKLGSVLIQHIFSITKQLQKQGIWLGVWQKNTRAIAFYEKHGFTKNGVTQFLLGGDVQDDWIMLKLLP